MAIGVAIIGGGIFVREEHLPAVQASKDFNLKAVYSRSLKSAQRLPVEDDVELYSDDSGSGNGLTDLLHRSEIQAVIVALPILVQPKYIRQALSAGKHVLSEKPVAENLRDAQDLISWYHGNVDSKKITWSVAENFRYLKSLEYAREQVHRAGKLLQFSVRAHSMVREGWKYFETEWRKNPTHQGGFLLDGGIHRIAGLRFLLGPENTIDRVSAYTAQLQKHLPPVDTMNAILKTKHGATGNLSISFGTSFKSNELAMACEGGTINVARSTVTTVFDGKEEIVEIKDEGSGVLPEIRAWGKALAKGERNEKQIPEEALADLELMERMLKSGEANGEQVDCILQI